MSHSLSPMDQEAIRAIVREEIAADELRRTNEPPRQQRCDRCCRCATPGGDCLPASPGVLHFCAGSDGK